MKVAPVSGDFLVKAGMALAAVVALAWLANKAKNGAADLAGQALDAAGNAVWAVTPWNNDNVIYQTANAGLAAVTGNHVDTLGTAIYGWTHPDPSASQGAPDWNVAPDGVNGPQYNNPSAYVAPSPDYRVLSNWVSSWTNTGTGQ